MSDDLSNRDRPDFSLLRTRIGLDPPTEIAAARARIAVQLLRFDVLRLDGDGLMGRPRSERRDAPERLVEEDATPRVPSLFRSRAWPKAQAARIGRWS